MLYPKKMPGLTAEEEVALSARWRELGDRKALDELATSHLGLARKIAAEFRDAGPSFEDLVQEGSIGLVVAAERFDARRGVRFAVYAGYWVRAYMIRLAMVDHGPVKIGTSRHQRRIFFNYGRARRRLERLGRDADYAAVAREIGGGVTAAHVEEMAPRMHARDLPLDASIGDDDERSAAELLACPRPSPEEVVLQAEDARVQRERIRTCLSELSPRERGVVRARYLGREPATLEAVGLAEGVSRQRVKQIEVRALGRLRASLDAMGVGASA